MIKKLFRQMLISQILSSMTVSLCMLIDSMMIGRFLRPEALTAYGLTTPVLLIFAAIGNMIGAGVQVLCGKATGRNDIEGANACFTVSASVCGAVSVAGAVLCFVFARPLAVMLGAGEDPVVLRLTADYLRGFIVGAPAFMAAQVMVPYFQITGRRSRLVTAVVCMTVADILLDILNVTVLPLETLGMGLASSVSYYVAFAIGIPCFIGKKALFRFRAKLLKKKTALRLLRYGVPTVVNQLSLVAFVYLLNNLLLGVGDTRNGLNAVAAYSVITTIGNICYSFGSGVANVALTLSSIFYTDKDRTSLRTLVSAMTYYAAVIDVALIVMILPSAPFLVDTFLDNPGARQMAITGLRLFSLSLLPSAINTSFKLYFQGINHSGLTQVLSVLQNFALPALFAVGLDLALGVNGIWLSFLCGETLTLLVISVIVWIKNGRVSFTPDAYSYLPRDYGVAQEDLLELSVNDREGAKNAAERAYAFCLDHGESEELCNDVMTCIREVTDNILSHGFTKDKKTHSIDVRVVKDGDDTVIRIRDNCFNFDPVRYMRDHKERADSGLMRVNSRVKDASYVNSLGLNNLTLTV